MVVKSIIVSPGIRERTVVFDGGRIEEVPDDWAHLPPGDATWTRRVKAAGPSWTVQEKRGRKTFGRGIYAPATLIKSVKNDLDAERSTEKYQRQREAQVRRREKQQTEYVDDFHGAVVTFLRFHDRYQDVAEQLAQQVTDHTTPVGSGTVARTKRIPIEERAESAVIAWLRHQTTGYDQMRIPRVRGRRREVRRMLAERSRALLKRYRDGQDIPAACPLRLALSSD